MAMRTPAAIAAALTAIMFVGCGHDAPEEKKPPLVRTQRAQTKEAAGLIYPCTIRARYETNMAFQTGGQIISRNAETGSRVKNGDVLMTLDAKDALQQKNAADATTANAKAQLALAAANLNRYRALYDENAVPAATLDQYQTSYDAALAAYQNAVASSVLAGNVLSYTNLTAGADGIVSAINAEEGQIVAAGQTVLTLIHDGELEAEINVPENRIGEISVGQSARVSLWARTGNIVGIVREIAPAADATAKTYRVRLSLVDAPDDIYLGMTASVSFDENESDGKPVSIPLSALYQTDSTPKVWLVKNGKVFAKTVRVVSFDENNALAEGLDDGDIIVTAGAAKLAEGQEVRTENGSRQ